MYTSAKLEKYLQLNYNVKREHERIPRNVGEIEISNTESHGSLHFPNNTAFQNVHLIKPSFYLFIKLLFFWGIDLYPLHVILRRVYKYFNL